MSEGKAFVFSTCYGVKNYELRSDNTTAWNSSKKKYQSRLSMRRSQKILKK